MNSSEKKMPALPEQTLDERLTYSRKLLYFHEMLSDGENKKVVGRLMTRALNAAIAKGSGKSV